MSDQMPVVAWDWFHHRRFGAPGEKQHRAIWTDAYIGADGDLQDMLNFRRNDGDVSAKTIHLEPLVRQQDTLAAIAAVEAECDALRADRDSWRDQASDRVADAVWIIGERDALRAALADVLSLPQLAPEFDALKRGIGTATPVGAVLLGARAALAAQPKAEPVDALRERVRDAIAENLGDVYVCTCVWSAWSVGTMSQDDFSPAGEDDDVLDALTNAALAAQPDGRVS